MGKPLTIQPEDDLRLEAFKKSLGVKTKVDVLRTALNVLEAKLNRQERIKRWNRAAKIVSKESMRVNREFQKHSLFKKP